MEEEVIIKNAFYIKLGEKGKWEESSIKENKIRIGWGIQSLEDINKHNWDTIRQREYHYHNNKTIATKDTNDLILICDCTEEDIWITFYLSKLWWCRVGEPRIYEDHISKYRNVKDIWKDSDAKGNPLLINQISGRISKLQGYRGTLCRVHAVDDLRCLLNAQPTREYQEILRAKNELINEVEKGLRTLHWKDFELLVDLIFRNSGWERISLLGETMKFVDMELLDPITKDQYQVQIKSEATAKDFQNYVEQFASRNYRKFYFVVHTPKRGLDNYEFNQKDNVELILPNRLAKMVVELGLLNWLMNKISQVINK